MCVLYAGKIVEDGPVDEVLAAPHHPYTQGLLRAVPRIEDGRANRLRDIPGTVPSPAEIARMEGCAFAPRCEFATAECLKAGTGDSKCTAAADHPAVD
jgi:oligopeptide/dipeptide ABC transporter ATP-binding protein